mgnify:CR=1 FL=1
MENSIALHSFLAEHIPLGMQLKESANWNQVMADWELLLRLSSGGAFVATYNGKGVGTVVTIEYEDLGSWIGMVLVNPTYRGRGIGTHLLKAALAYAQPKGPVLLDATALGQPLYHSLGFQVVGKVARLELVVPPSTINVETENISPLQGKHLGQLITYDQHKIQFNRAALIEDLFQREPGYAFVAYQQHQIVGYALGRAGSQFHHIGPLVADNREVAQALLGHVFAKTPQRAMIIDVPTNRENWYAYLLQQGFTLQRSFIRMCLGDLTKTPDGLIQFAIAGPALA